MLASPKISQATCFVQLPVYFFLRLVVLSQRREHPGSESSHLKESELVYRIAVFLKFHNPQRHGTNCFIILFWAQGFLYIVMCRTAGKLCQLSCFAGGNHQVQSSDGLAATQGGKHGLKLDDWILVLRLGWWLTWWIKMVDNCFSCSQIPPQQGDNLEIP